MTDCEHRPRNRTFAWVYFGHGRRYWYSVTQYSLVPYETVRLLLPFQSSIDLFAVQIGREYFMGSFIRGEEFRTLSIQLGK